MTFARVVLWLSVLAWAGFGIMFLGWPERLGGVDLEVVTGLARIEVRGFYGGLELGLAAFLAWSALADDRLRSGLLLAALAPGCTALGRLTGIAIEGGTGSLMMWSFVALEGSGALLAAVALARLPRRASSPRP